MFYLLAAFILGTLVGSFLNVIILRLPKGEKLTGRSHCNNCGHALGILDLFPLFSYLFLSGHCRHCKHKISARYFFIEFITGLLFALSWWYIQPYEPASFILLLKDFFVVSVLISVFVIDLEQYLILDSIVFPSLVFVSLLNLAQDVLGRQQIFSLQSNFFGGLIAAAAASLPFFLVWYFSKGAWMGFGDVKLALFLGAALGLSGVFVGLMLAVLLGGVVSVFLLLFAKKTLKSHIPFGTFLSLGSVLALFYGQKLLSWYLSFLGF